MFVQSLWCVETRGKRSTSTENIRKSKQSICWSFLSRFGRISFFFHFSMNKKRKVDRLRRSTRDDRNEIRFFSLACNRCLIDRKFIAAIDRWSEEKKEKCVNGTTSEHSMNIRCWNNIYCVAKFNMKLITEKESRQHETLNVYSIGFFLLSSLIFFVSLLFFLFFFFDWDRSRLRTMIFVLPVKERTLRERKSCVQSLRWDDESWLNYFNCCHITLSLSSTMNFLFLVSVSRDSFYFSSKEKMTNNLRRRKEIFILSRTNKQTDERKTKENNLLIVFT